MFKPMRRQDRKISDTDALELLKSTEYGVLSMVGLNGYGYGVPVNFVFLNNAIYFHCAHSGSKLENISQNNRVSFCAVGKTEPIPEKFSFRYESVIVFGQAVEISGQEKIDALIALIEKYSPDYIDSGKEYINKDANKSTVIKIAVEHFTGKARR